MFNICKKIYNNLRIYRKKIKNEQKEKLQNSIDNLIRIFQKSNIEEWSYLLGNRKEIIKRNFIAGIARGVGIGIGVTIITAILIIILQKIVTLNIPIIGEYISDIIDIVQKSR
ncbi:MAG: DUF5665 domain-containing protein [Clostridia bacterium]|nr:hypothetical protein [Clostridium sp.]MBS6251860.1 hypothetical protein [Clostridium sp.]